jgi:tetratricopeptide (TPR) repeat protein
MDVTTPSGTPVTATPRRLRKVWIGVGGGLTVCGLLAICLLVWPGFLGDSAEARMARARLAIGKGDRQELEFLAGQMEAAGQIDHAHFARGEWHLAQGRKYLKEVDELHRLHAIAWSMQNLLDAGRWSFEAPAGGRGFFLGAMSDPQLALFIPALSNLLSLQKRAQGQLQLAFKQLSEIALDSPLADEAALPAAEALLRLRETGAVVPLEGPYRLLHHALQAHPDSLEAHRWLAIVCLDLNALDEAMTEAREVGRLDPHDGRPYRSLGLLLSNRAKYGAAMEAYNEALRRELKPAMRLDAIAELARLQASKGMATEALKTLDLCPPDSRDRPALATVRAEALWVSNPQQHGKEAVQILERVLQVQSDFEPAVRLLGRIHMADNRAANARPLLERAVRLAPHDHEVRHLLAQCLRSLGENAAADEQVRRAEQARRIIKDLEAATM